MRRVRAGLVVGVLLAAGCSGGDDGRADDDPPGTPGAGSSIPSPTVSTLAPPSEPLSGETVLVVGDEVWVVGGVAGYSPYEVNRTITRRAVDGEVLGTIPLELPDGVVLQGASAPITVGGTTYLVGFRCPIHPEAENGPCGAGEGVLHRVGAEGLTELPVPASWEAESAASSGHPPFVVGTVGERFVTTRSAGDGPIPVTTEVVVVTAVDPETAEVTTVPTVNGVLTLSSVCADGGRIWSIAPALDGQQRVTGTDLWVQDDPIGAPDAPPRHVATITLDAPRRITSGRLYCADGFVVVTGSTDGGAFAVVDTATGEVVGDVTGWDDWGVRLGVPPGGDGSRLIASRIDEVRSEEPVTHQVVTHDGVTDLPEGAVPTWEVGIFPAPEVVEVDGRLLDVSAWVAEPDVEQPPIELA